MQDYSLCTPLHGPPRSRDKIAYKVGYVHENIYIQYLYFICLFICYLYIGRKLLEMSAVCHCVSLCQLT